MKCGLNHDNLSEVGWNHVTHLVRPDGAEGLLGGIGGGERERVNFGQARLHIELTDGRTDGHPEEVKATRPKAACISVC